MKKYLQNGNCENITRGEFEKLSAQTLHVFGIDDFQLEVSFVSKNKIEELNREHRGVDKPTDVLSFPQFAIESQKTKILGNIAICNEIVADKEEEITDVLKHAILHLIGYDHESDPADWDAAAKKIECNL